MPYLVAIICERYKITSTFQNTIKRSASAGADRVQSFVREGPYSRLLSRAVEYRAVEAVVAYDAQCLAVVGRERVDGAEVGAVLV